MDPADRMLQLQHLYGLSHPSSSSSSSSVPSAMEGATIELANLSRPTSGIADVHQSFGQMGISGMMPSQSQLAFVSNGHYASNATLDRSPPPSGASHNASEPHPGAFGSETGTDDDIKTPNVYINGLPPHFPEDELFKLANEFGPIRSVRTFTRHVRDSESGYGFVLFENMDDAEQCIISLRKYRNLHPTFSKQIHKIPGTNYTAGPSTSSSSSWQASLSSENLSTSASFKAKMESLHDPSSTNLYLEGLPLSIDETALSALVTPHRIVSSRFFQTRLSNPPRIIAFVRLETRIGAEEVIERLHGRMVRGLNDTGSRISVRFADTSEQRELRRTERATQEGDVSSSRLTIAQASLLNLRGQDLRPESKLAASQSQTSFNHTPSSSARGFPFSASVPEFSTNTATHRNGFSNDHHHLATANNGLEVDYTLGLRRHGAMGAGDLRSPSPYGLQQDFGTHYSSTGYTGGYAQSTRDHSRTLLDSLRTNSISNRANGHSSAFSGGEGDFYSQGRDYHGLGTGFASTRHLNTGVSHTNLQQLQQHVLASHSLDDLNSQQFTRPTPAYTRTGYTATEEYIMRTHTENGVASHQRNEQYDLGQQERRRPARLDLGHDRGILDPSSQGAGMRGQRSAMSPSSMDHLSGFATMGLSNGVRTAGLTEDALHSGTTATTRSRQPARIARDPGSAPPTMTSMQIAYSATQKTGSSPPLAAVSSSTADHDQQALSPTFSPTMSMTSPNPDEVVSAYHQASAAHARSTTLPQQRQTVAGRKPRGHLSHNSMSMPKQNVGTPQHANVARLGGHAGLDAALNNVIYESGEHTDQKGSKFENGETSGPTSSSQNQGVLSSVLKTRQSAFGDVDQSSSDSPMSASSSLISPTLTYSTQTPSTLSPATPFFGSFNSHMDAFEKVPSSGQTTSSSQCKPSPDATADVGVSLRA
ncbi:hypothetical protein CPB83DRAFT_859584 [Crepidotus variabilis]|uniref:RRM domain-containing protein n=1 Tax=Crepidotus variabilis TaxID=179855 RepID=A0A9P6EAF7_9AGAR|nr:hypothetical protein CPB83DRAFT_859584 [Crepidotus variabilis]